MKVTIKNDFHGTKVNLNAKEGSGRILELSAGQVDRAANRLCPSNGCSCGNFMGARGPQDISFIPMPNGGALALKGAKDE